MRKGTKACIPRSELQDLLKIKNDGVLRGVSYDAETDSFCLVVESAEGKDSCKIGSSTVLFRDQMPETGNWPLDYVLG